MQIYLIGVTILTKSHGNDFRCLACRVVRALNRKLINLRNLLNIVVLILFLEECCRHIRQHIGVHADVNWQLWVILELSAYHTTVERWEKLCSSAEVSPLTKRIHLVVVWVIDSVVLESGNRLLVVVAVFAVWRTNYPKVV